MAILIFFGVFTKLWLVIKCDVKLGFELQSTAYLRNYGHLKTIYGVFTKLWLVIKCNLNLGLQLQYTAYLRSYSHLRSQKVKGLQITVYAKLRVSVVKFVGFWKIDKLTFVCKKMRAFIIKCLTFITIQQPWFEHSYVLIKKYFWRHMCLKVIPKQALNSQEPSICGIWAF